MKTRSKNDDRKDRVTLKMVAERVGLSAGTVSSVLNNSPAALTVPQHTKERILAAARELNYRPHFLARSLRVQRTSTIGVISEEISDPFGGGIISGIERYLQSRGYFILMVSYRHKQNLLKTYSNLLLERGVEGFITVNTTITESPGVPTVAVAGRRQVDGVTNLAINHGTAARMILTHLSNLGHKEIAVLKGHASSPDSEDRWVALHQVSRELKTPIKSDRMIQLVTEEIVPEDGYEFTKKLLARNKPFTALCAYNDTSAIGAVRALHEAGLRVPEEVSVVGFDDIAMAAYHNPALTTVRQPLREMGELAAQTLLCRIEDPESTVPDISIEPQFVIRASTGPRKETTPSGSPTRA